jgi:hypothetical protein
VPKAAVNQELVKINNTDEKSKHIYSYAIKALFASDLL